MAPVAEAEAEDIVVKEGAAMFDGKEGDFGVAEFAGQVRGG